MNKHMNQLIGQLHDAIADQQKSPEVARLMRDMDMHIKQWDAKNNQSDMALTIDHLLAELEVNHPQSVAIARKMVDVLASMGV